MNTAESLVSAALKVLEAEGESGFSTRAVCALANVTAPTLYHHFGSADTLLSAAIALAFEQFVTSKNLVRSTDPVDILAEGWDSYVGFAAERPRLYSAMMARVLQGAEIPAAQQGYAILVARIEAVAAQGRLAMDVPMAANFLWASANGAALLCATSRPERTAGPPPDTAIKSLRDAAMRAVCRPHSEEGVS